MSTNNNAISKQVAKFNSNKDFVDFSTPIYVPMNINNSSNFHEIDNLGMDSVGMGGLELDSLDIKESYSSSSRQRSFDSTTTKNSDSVTLNHTDTSVNNIDIDRSITPALELSRSLSRGESYDSNKDKREFIENELYENQNGKYFQVKRTKNPVNDWVCTEFVPITLDNIIGDNQPDLQDNHLSNNHQWLDTSFKQQSWEYDYQGNRYSSDIQDFDPGLSLYAAKYQNSNPIPSDMQIYGNSLVPNNQPVPYYHYDYNPSVVPPKFEYQNFFV